MFWCWGGSQEEGQNWGLQDRQDNRTIDRRVGISSWGGFQYKCEYNRNPGDSIFVGDMDMFEEVQRFREVGQEGVEKLPEQESEGSERDMMFDVTIVDWSFYEWYLLDDNLNISNGIWWDYGFKIWDKRQL